MKTASLLLTVIAIPAAALLHGCGSDADAVSDAFSSSFALTCDGPDDDPTTGSAATSMLERCIYYASTQSLALNLENGEQDGAINLDVVGFHGVGTYLTGTSEANSTTVYVSTGLVHAGTWESLPVGSFSAHTCTITVEKTNLTEVLIPSGSEGHGYIVVSLDCAMLGSAAVGELTCALTPSTFHFSVASCSAVE